MTLGEEEVRIRMQRSKTAVIATLTGAALALGTNPAYAAADKPDTGHYDSYISTWGVGEESSSWRDQKRNNNDTRVEFAGCKTGPTTTTMEGTGTVSLKLMNAVDWQPDTWLSSKTINCRSARNTANFGEWWENSDDGYYFELWKIRGNADSNQIMSVNDVDVYW
jgi:hypothetical protein